MSLPQDLLDQAYFLATKEPRRPRQASLRRAVSTAYYGLFHFLIDEATGYMVSGRAAPRVAQRNLLGRAYGHAHMRRTAVEFSTGAGGVWEKVAGSVPPSLRSVARSLLDLQGARHRADYDRFARFSRAKALAAIEQARVAMTDFQQAAGTPAAEAFLLGLLVRPRA